MASMQDPPVDRVVFSWCPRNGFTQSENCWICAALTSWRPIPALDSVIMRNGCRKGVGGVGGWPMPRFVGDFDKLLTKSYNFPKKETNHPQFLNISPEIILILQNMSIYAKTGSGGSKAINQNRWRSLYFGGFPIISTIAVDENAIHNYNASRSSWAKASLETASKPGIQTIIRPTLSLAEASSLQLKTIK